MTGSGSAGPVGVVLAGGASSRMGTDKAFVDVDGAAMVLRVAAALRAGGCARVTCQGGDGVRLAALGLTTVPDVLLADGTRPGPVRSVVAAVAGATGDPVVVSACDLPALTGGVVASLVGTAERTGRVAVAASDGRRHLIAAWPRSALPVAEAAVADGIGRYHELLDRVGAVEVAVDDGVVRNANRPEDLAPRSPDR